MKYLEYTPFDRINAFLDHLNLGEHTIKGCIEAYSCSMVIFKFSHLIFLKLLCSSLGKHTGTDRRLSLSLENEPKDDDLSDPHIISYVPGLCFQCSESSAVLHSGTWQGFKQIFDSYMSDASKEWIEADEDGSLLETLYKTLDEVINLAECEIYSYDPNSDAHPFIEKGALNLVTEGFPTDGIYYDDDGGIFDDMDM